MVSYDLKALFKLEPVDSVISIVKSKLLQDPLLSHMTSMSVKKTLPCWSFAW